MDLTLRGMNIHIHTRGRELKNNINKWSSSIMTFKCRSKRATIDEAAIDEEDEVAATPLTRERWASIRRRDQTFNFQLIMFIITRWIRVVQRSGDRECMSVAREEKLESRRSSLA